MCDISQKTNFKQKTVYKTVLKQNGKYFSLFAMHKLRKGSVVNSINTMKAKAKKILGTLPGCLKNSSSLYNVNMKGLVSGFDRKQDAITLSRPVNGDNYLSSRAKQKGELVILKIVLGGTILEGTTDLISSRVPYVNKTYAGSIIKSMIEI